MDTDKYWKNYWQNDKNINSSDLHQNVARTQNGIPINSNIWNQTIKDIKELLSINNSVDIVELCCGNGQLIGHLAKYCKRAVGVDYSQELLNQMKYKFGNKVKPILSDVLDVEFKEESFDIVIIYFSLQYFNKKDSIILINNSLNWLRKKGKIYIGDIPNELKKWEYIDKPEYKKDYIQRIIEKQPKIGFWYQPGFFLALSSYFQNITVEIIEQPYYQINSSYRFDVLIEKKY